MAKVLGSGRGCVITHLLRLTGIQTASVTAEKRKLVMSSHAPRTVRVTLTSSQHGYAWICDFDLLFCRDTL